jgi:hypothetical protein
MYRISAPTRRANDGPGLATTHRCRARHDRNESYQKFDGLPPGSVHFTQSGEHAMSIIDATDRFPGDRKRSQRRMSRRFPKSVIDLLSIRAKRKWTAEEARALFCPAMKGLPFVAPKEPGGNVCAGMGNYHWWSDEPTELAHGDHNRGRVYAWLLVRAIEEDRPLQNPQASRFGAPGFLR